MQDTQALLDGLWARFAEVANLSGFQLAQALAISERPGADQATSVQALATGIAVALVEAAKSNAGGALECARDVGYELLGTVDNSHGACCLNAPARSAHNLWWLLQSYNRDQGHDVAEDLATTRAQAVALLAT